jgi:hypothetical protein
VAGVDTSTQQPLERGYLAMPKIYVPFTEHTAETMWAKFSLANSGRLARGGQDLSLHMRLFLVGFGRVSNRGHAPFSRGELQQIMVRPDGSTFEERHIRNEIARLVESNMLAPVSNIRCLLYPKELIVLTTEKKNVTTCPEHGTHSSWSSLNNDWAPDYLPQVPSVEPKVPETSVGIHISDWNIDVNSIGDGTYDAL